MVLLLADAGLTLGLRLWGSLDVRGAAKAKVLQEWTMMASRGLYDLHEGGASLAQGAGDSLRSLLYVAVFLGLAWPLWSGRDVS
jgi:hypothetical protein